MQKRILCYAVACLLSLNVFSQYIYEGNQSLVDLTNESNTTNLNSGDDQLSSAFNLDFTFDFYGESFTSARMATNGCLHFGLGTGSINYNNYCGDYTPDPLPQYNYTLFPFWTDLIRDSNSKMLAKNFSDKTVFGWYDMREYNRASDNSFEVILWTNDSYEFRYGELDVIQHDVLIGEQGKSDEIYTYYYHDECNTGSTNTASCYNYDWNNSDKNQNLEDGGSLYSDNNSIDCSNPLNDTSCAGYAAAYQTQQCNITQLYNESCPYYWEAYDDLQCDLDPQYGPFCPGYRQENSIAYFQEEEIFDYGYEEYDEYDTFENIEIFEEFLFIDEYDNFEEQEFIFEEEIVFEVYEEFIDPFEIRLDFEDPLELPLEDLIIEEFIFQETFLVEDFSEPETFIEIETIEQLEEWFEEEMIIEEEIAFAEPEEEIIEEIVEEESIEEAIEEETMPEEKSSISKATALKVVASTIITANQSVSGTNSGNTAAAQGGSSTSRSSSGGSGGGISTSSSPSMSDQFASSTAQNNQVLDMSTNISNSGGGDTGAVNTVEVVVNTTSSDTLQNQIDVSITTNSTSNESEQIVEDVIAQNMQLAQEEAEAIQEETGQYGSEDIVISYIGFLPGFNSYSDISMPGKEFWYEPKSIYTNSTLSDNTEAFYSMAGQSIRTLTDLKEMQPKL
mgnify:CR=1 FL=1